MRDLIGMDHLVNDDYARRKDHRQHGPGAPQAQDWHAADRRYWDDIEDARHRKNWCSRVDQAWLVCLVEADCVEPGKAVTLFDALDKVLQQPKGWGGENQIAEVLDGDVDTASIVNYGRTLQEPMSRLQLRAKAIEVLDDILGLLESVHASACRHTDVIMPGYTHLSQAQPITWSHYMLSIFDGIHRGLKQFELGYVDTNRNSGGCGACSGTLWPVNRYRMTELLGFDDLMEPTFDSESAQDHSLSLLFASSNIGLLLSKAAMDLNIWGMEEMNMVRVHPEWVGVSSLMPQKCIPGSQYERTRIWVNDLLGTTVNCMFQCKGEPHEDMLPMLYLPERAMEGLAHLRRAMAYMTGMLDHTYPRKEQMLQHVKDGYSCSSEVVIHLVRKCNYGHRSAHRVTATLIRQARIKGLRPYELTGEMLDEAARFTDDPEPGLDTKTLRRLFDPEEFIRTHNQVGGPAPEENTRMLKLRESWIHEARKRQQQRKERIAQGDTRLAEAIEAIRKKA